MGGSLHHRRYFGKFIPHFLAEQYLAGCVLLGAAPCTAMVFVWSYLTKGDAAYTLVQVAVNDLILLVAFVPTVAFLLGMGGISIPWDTLASSVILFVVIPLVAGILSRRWAIAKKGKQYFFELAVAVAISLVGLNSGAALATVVGVLVEVPVMLILVKIANKWHRCL